MNIAMPKIGLYYPFMQFGDSTWLKVAALYWDKVARIVPPGVRTRDDRDVLALTDELGFISNLTPSMDALQAVSDQVLDLIDEDRPLLYQWYGIGPEMAYRGLNPWSNAPHLTDLRRNTSLDPSLVPLSDERLAYVYAGKMTPELRHALEDAGLGSTLSDYGLVGMHPELAFLYMHLLAHEMAASVMHPVTTVAFDHVLFGRDSRDLGQAVRETVKRLETVGVDESLTGHGRVGRSMEEVEVDFASIALRCVVPEAIYSVPVERIIEFRRSHEEELTAFQLGVQSIVAEVPDVVASLAPAEYALYLDSLYQKVMKPEVVGLKTSLERSGIDAVFGAMSVKVVLPEAVTSGGALLGLGLAGMNPLVLGAAAIVCTLVPRVRQHRRNTEQLRGESSVAYLLALEGELEPRSLALAIGEIAKRVLPGEG